VFAMVKRLCGRTGTEKLETSVYHSETEGTVELNRTHCEVLAKDMIGESVRAPAHTCVIAGLRAGVLPDRGGH
jgi:hypothetical protein